MLKQFAIPSIYGYTDKLVVSESIEPKSLDFIVDSTIYRISKDEWNTLKRAIDDYSFSWEGLQPSQKDE